MINIAVMDLDNMTQQNAALVEETASESEEMSSQALELMNMTKVFKINSEIKTERDQLIKSADLTEKKASLEKKMKYEKIQTPVIKSADSAKKGKNDFDGDYDVF